jgi:hypothetical protein
MTRILGHHIHPNRGAFRHPNPSAGVYTEEMGCVFRAVAIPINSRAIMVFVG